MTYFILLILCLISFEFLHFIKFFDRLNTTLFLTKKVLKILSSVRISDHWKEKIILNYACSLMSLSIQMLLVMISIISVFFIVNIFISDLVLIALSPPGMAFSLFSIIGYSLFRKATKNG